MSNVIREGVIIGGASIAPDGQELARVMFGIRARHWHWNMTCRRGDHERDCQLADMIRRGVIDSGHVCADAVANLVSLDLFNAAIALFEKVVATHASADVRQRVIVGTPNMMAHRVCLSPANADSVYIWAAWRKFKRIYCRISKFPKLIEGVQWTPGIPWAKLLLKPNERNWYGPFGTELWTTPGWISDIIFRILSGWYPFAHPFWWDVYVSRVVAARGALRLMEERARADPELCAQPGRSVNTNLFAELILDYV